MKKHNKRYIGVSASMHDILVFFQRMKETNPDIKDNKETLEFILNNYFGFDKDYVFEETGGWYTQNVCEHRTVFTGKVVKATRFMGCERTDKEWYDTGMMSGDAWSIYKGVVSGF